MRLLDWLQSQTLAAILESLAALTKKVDKMGSGITDLTAAVGKMATAVSNLQTATQGETKAITDALAVLSNSGSSGAEVAAATKVINDAAANIDALAAGAKSETDAIQAALAPSTTPPTTP